ncbi:MAG: hypothetical protein ABSC36_01280 [Gaiellaceae bacterium]
MRITTALVTALLCGVLLFGSSVSQAAPAATWGGTRCLGYKEPRASNTVCDYGFRQPFVLKGYSRGGSSTLSYTVQCRKNTSDPPRRAQIDHRIWFKRTFTVQGNFKIYGTRDALPATRHCDAAHGEGPVLTVRLEMGKGTTRTSLIVSLDSTLPWGH